MILYGLKKGTFDNRICEPALNMTDIETIRKKELKETTEKIANFLLTTYDLRVTDETFRDFFFRKDRAFWDYSAK